MACYPGSALSIPQLMDALDRKLSSELSDDVSTGTNFEMEEWDELESKGTRILTRLRSIRNTCSPVNRLLPETLALVFRYVANECHAEGQGNLKWAPVTLPRHWITVTHVCRYWYDTALYFHSLWSIVDYAYPSIAPLCLERSKYALLDVRIGSDAPDEFLQQLQPHICRCYTLQSDVVIEERKVFISDWHTEADPFFSHHRVPNLRHLCLRNCVTSQPFKLKNLVTLDLVYVNGMSPTLDELLNMLEANPFLENVAITNAVNAVFHEDFKPRLVWLHHIRTFWLVHCAAHAILECLHLQRGVDLGVELRPDLFAKTLPSSLNHLENMGDLQKFRLSSQRLHAVGPSGSAFFNASIHERSFGKLAERGARELWLGPTIFPPNYKPGLGDFWSSLNALHTLVLVSCSRTVDLLNGLELVDGETLIPRLRHLTIYDDSGLQASGLIKVLQARKSRGFPIERLKVIVHPDHYAAMDGLNFEEVVQDFELEIKVKPPKWPFELPLGTQKIFPARALR